MRLKQSALLAGLVAIALHSFAGPLTAVPSQPVWLSGGEILGQFKDATIDGRYASGKAFTERYAADGGVIYKEPGVTLSGHWSVTEGTLCTIYEGDTSGGCYRVARVARNCYEFYFVSRTEAAAPGAPDGKPAWTARGAVQGQATSCHDQPSV
jgi:hypothetical protein